jgi:hypothetical protein
MTGVPDRIVLLPKRLLLVELKTPKGVISERQKLVFERFEELGHPVHVVRTREEVEQLL